MLEKDRDFIRQHVLRVMAEWSVTPGPRGSGPGDVEDWIDHIVANRGWEPYWELDRMPREFLEKGYHKGGTPPPPTPPPTDPYMAKLNAMHADIQTILNGVRKYF